MALVNTAAELALRGRRVLVVDFDLEAPGLDSFNLLKPSRQVPGIIDFINDYLETGQVPEVNRFLGECLNIGEEGGSLTLMPSGSSKVYAKIFNQISWDSLYRLHEGYLLFEDLKAQWKQTVNPDYVLIDSRTGYTDVGGICTRQLPNAVVALFFPNEQNLRGLISVVRDIRFENESSQNKNIDLHFVMSNVPDLDDEDQILADKINAFRDCLKIPQEPITIHHYSSLSLLNQAVFVVDRPKSRLAKEYSDLTREILVRNDADRDGALDYISRASRPWEWDDDSLIKQEEMIDRIERAHPSDGHILFRLAKLKETFGDSDSAWLLFEKAIDAGHETPEAYLARSKYREKNDDTEGASKDIWRVFMSEQVSPRTLQEATSQLIRQNQGEGLLDVRRVVDSPSIASLSPDRALWLTRFCERNNKGLELAASILYRHLESGKLSQNQTIEFRHYLGMNYMIQGNCREAMTMFRGDNETISSLNIENAFNYGMALWASSGVVQKDIFQHVINLDIQQEFPKNRPNYLQCMAISCGLIGNHKAAVEYLQRAKREISDSNLRYEFSCWRYREVSTSEFVGDLDEISDQLKLQDALMPEFVKIARFSQGDEVVDKIDSSG